MNVLIAIRLMYKIRFNLVNNKQHAANKPSNEVEKRKDRRGRLPSAPCNQY